MAILIFQHSSTEGPGRIALTLRDHGKQLDVRRLDLPVNPARPEARGVPGDFDDVEGLVILGGTMNVTDDPASVPWMAREIEFIAEAHRRNLPVVGVCLGAQLIAKALGGEVGPMTDAAGQPTAEWGMATVRQTPPANTDIILAGIPWSMQQFHAHGQEVKKLPAGAMALQFSDKCKVQSFRVGLRTYAFQYHFECDLRMIESFLESGEPQIALAGVDPGRAMDDARVVCEEYARLSDRICVNLTSFLFPVSRAITA